MTIDRLLDAQKLFHRWFFNPLEVLRTSDQIKDGDGGIIAMMVALPLLERYLDYTRRAENKARTKYQILADETGLSEADAQTFWEMFRHGFCHQGMPLSQKDGKKLPEVSFSDKYPALPKVVQKVTGEPVFILDIWKFVQWALSKYEHNPEMLEENQSFPLLPISAVLS